MKYWFDWFIGIQTVHRTPNTMSLDKKFDPNWEFDTASTLGKLEKEQLGAWYLEMACKYGYFVAVPKNSPWERHHFQRVIGSKPRRFYGRPTLIKARDDGYINEMVAEGFLVSETTPLTGIEVISPSEKMAWRMYGRNKDGCTPVTRCMGEDRLSRLTIKDLVLQKYAD